MEFNKLLAQPYTLPNGVTIANRLAKAAMSEALGTHDNRPTSRLTKLYERWAAGGIGLCITGNVMIDSKAVGEPNNVALEDERDLEALQQWAEAGTQHGTALWMQLNHPGKQAPRGLNRETVAPSAVPFRPELRRFFDTPRELTEGEIEDLIERFARASRIAEKTGFTGVQIHGAHGYLVNQFLSPHHNQRSDKWGGSIANRRRFVLEVIAAIKSQVQPSFCIGIKLNSADFQRGGFTEEESLETIVALQDAGVHLIEISGGTYEAPAMTGKTKQSTRQREAYFLDFAEKARKLSRTPLMLTGGFRSVEGMANAISSGAVDFVGLARLLAVEPELPNRLLAGSEPLHTIAPRKTGIPLVDKMGFMEIAWYTRQLQRIGKGKEPRPNEAGFYSMLAYLVDGGFRTLNMRLRA